MEEFYSDEEIYDYCDFGICYINHDGLSFYITEIKDSTREVYFMHNHSFYLFTRFFDNWTDLKYIKGWLETEECCKQLDYVFDIGEIYYH